jgi:cytoskeletal protein RodZ
VNAKRQGYKRPRDQREVFIAIVAALAVVMITAVLIWALQPDDESDTPTTDVPATTQPVTTQPTPESTSSTPPSSTAPAPSSTAAGSNQ